MIDKVQNISRMSSHLHYQTQQQQRQLQQELKQVKQEMVNNIDNEIRSINVQI